MVGVGLLIHSTFNNLCQSFHSSFSSSKRTHCSDKSREPLDDSVSDGENDGWLMTHDAVEKT